MKSLALALVLALAVIPLAPALATERDADAIPGLGPATLHPLPAGGLLHGGPCFVGAPDGEEIFRDGLEGGAPGWSLLSTAGRPNLWHATEFAGNGSALDDEGHDGPGRLYYGVENRFGGTYNTSRTRNQGEARSPAFVVPADGARYALAFATKWHVEFDRPWLIDAMVVGTSFGGARSDLCYLGNAWAQFWNIPMGYGYYQASPWGAATFTGCEYALESPQNPCRFSEDFANAETAFDLAPDIALWEPRFVLLPQSAAGRSVHATFYFQTGDAIVDDAMGWMIDDVRVVKIG